MARIVLIGGGGFAKEVSDLALQAGHEVVGYAGSQPTRSKLVYLGELRHLLCKASSFDGVVIAYGGIDRRSILARGREIDEIEALGLTAISIISPFARVCTGAQIADGSIIGHNVIVSVDSTVGPHCVLNNGAQLGHDAILGRNVTLAPLAFVAGAVSIGADSLIGPCTSILQGRRLGERVIVSVGATVLRDIPNGATVLPSRSRVVVAETTNVRKEISE